MSNKPLAPSRALAAKLLFATFNILKDAGGSLTGKEVITKIESSVELGEWDKSVYEKTGNTRWVSILHFFTIDAIKAGFLIKEKGTWTLSNAGKEAIKLGEVGLLEACSEGYAKWKLTVPAKQQTETVVAKELKDEPPEELLESIISEINDNLAREILDIVKNCSPVFFERLVVALLVKMGYGGTLADAARVIGRSGDGGIDGIIDEDRLGLDAIYIQAKRWEGIVGRPEIQKFVGALQGQRAHKGVFITTSDFTKEAQEYVKNISNKVVLMNGFALARLMIENNVGVSVAVTYEVKKIDSDYFVDE
ncbi:MAG: restriction endonuclease [Methylotenera sp.]